MRDHGQRRNPLDCEVEFVESCRQAIHRRGFDAQFVVASAQVPDVRVPVDHDARRPVGLPSAHRTQSCLQPAVVGLTPFVLVLPGVVEGRRDQASPARYQQVTSRWPGRPGALDDFVRFAFHAKIRPPLRCYVAQHRSAQPHRGVMHKETQIGIDTGDDPGLDVEVGGGCGW